MCQTPCLHLTNVEQAQSNLKSAHCSTVLSTSRQRCQLVRQRFATSRLDGIAQDAPGEAVLKRTTQKLTL